MFLSCLVVLYCCCLYCTVFVCINEIVHVPLMFSGIVLLFRYCTVVVFIVQLFVLMRLFMFLSGLVVLYCCFLYCTAVVCIVQLFSVLMRLFMFLSGLVVLYCFCLYCTVVVFIVQLLSLLYSCCLY
jgi:hypothetical protein